MCATIFGIIFEPIYCSINCTTSICFNKYKLYAKVQLAAIAAIAIVRFNVCPHSTDLSRRVFDILPFATAILRPTQHKDGASELWNLYSYKISLFSLLLIQICFCIQILRIFKSHLSLKLLNCLSTQHRPPPTCFRYSTIRYSLIQGSDKTTSGFGTYIQRRLSCENRFWCNWCSGLRGYCPAAEARLMLLLCAVIM